MRGLSPNFYIYVSVSGLNIPRIGPHIFLQQNRQTHPWKYIYKITHRNMNVGIGRAVPFLGIFVTNFRYCVFAVHVQASSAPNYFMVVYHIIDDRYLMWFLSFLPINNQEKHTYKTSNVSLFGAKDGPCAIRTGLYLPFKNISVHSSRFRPLRMRLAFLKSSFPTIFPAESNLSSFYCINGI